MSETYRVVFTGQVEPGKDLEQVIDRFSEKFKLERGLAEKVIRAGRPVSLKKDLSLDKAEKYLAVLQQIGIMVELDPKPPEPEPPAAPSGFELEPLDHGGGDTTEVLEHVPGVDHCPKCGSSRMEMGICQDCGIVAAKYLAAQAARQGEGASATETAAAQENPYTAPEAELETPEAAEMNGPHAVPLLSGLSWIGQGWDYFRSSPVGWILALIVWVVLSIVISLIPFLGGIVLLLIGPVIMGGFMLGCHAQDEGGDFTLGHLFAGFSNNTGQLVLVGVLYFALSFVASLVMGMVVAFTVGGMSSAMDPQNMEMMAASMGAPLTLFMLLFLVIFLMIMMTYVFAPSLVALDGIDAISAMKLSFTGCLRNLLPLIVYGIVGTVISVIVVVPLVLGIFSIIPLWLGVVLLIVFSLILFPIFTGSIYSAYRDIYYG